jgi:hypothetical protein
MLKFFGFILLLVASLASMFLLAFTIQCVSLWFFAMHFSIVSLFGLILVVRLLTLHLKPAFSTSPGEDSWIAPASIVLSTVATSITVLFVTYLLHLVM